MSKMFVKININWNKRLNKFYIFIRCKKSPYKIGGLKNKAQENLGCNARRIPRESIKIRGGNNNGSTF